MFELVGTRVVPPHLAIDPVDLPILILQLAAHVDRHVSQIADHRVHLAHVLLHLCFTSVVRDLGDVATLRAQPVAIVHHPLGLVVDNLTVIVPLPRALVFLEAGASAEGKSTSSSADRYRSRFRETRHIEQREMLFFSYFFFLASKDLQDLQGVKKNFPSEEFYL